MTGRIRVVMIEADGDAAERAIEMALQALAPGAGKVVASVAPPVAAPPVSLPPASPVRKSIEAPARRRSSVAPAPARRAAVVNPADVAEPIEVNGITIAGNEIRYGGKSITVTPRECQLARALAKVSPSLADPDRIARDVWNRSRADAQPLIYQACSALNAAVQAIGLKVHTQRGIGIALVPA